MIARSTTQVVAGSTMPRRATKRALDLHATLQGRGFAGDPPCSSGITCFADEPTLALKRRSTCEGNDHSLRLASRVSYRKADRHGHAGLVQDFPRFRKPASAIPDRREHRERLPWVPMAHARHQEWGRRAPLSPRRIPCRVAGTPRYESCRGEC